MPYTTNTPINTQDFMTIPEYVTVYYVNEDDICPVERIGRDFVSDVDHIKAPITDTRFTGNVYGTYAAAARGVTTQAPAPMSEGAMRTVAEGDIVYHRCPSSDFVSALQRTGDGFHITGTSSTYAIDDPRLVNQVYAREADAHESHDARIARQSDAQVMQTMFDGWVKSQVEDVIGDDAFIAMQHAIRARFGIDVEMPDTDAMYDAARDREYD